VALCCAGFLPSYAPDMAHHWLPWLLLGPAGKRSNDSFFQQFGFIPPRNPHDDVALFDNIEDAVQWLCTTLTRQVNLHQVLVLRLCCCGRLLPPKAGDACRLTCLYYTFFKFLHSSGMTEASTNCQLTTSY